MCDRCEWCGRNLLPLTDEERELLDYMRDFRGDTTRDGKLRCEGLHMRDLFSGWFRCTEAAKLRVLVKPGTVDIGTDFCSKRDGEGEYLALVCHACCPHSSQQEELSF